MCIRDRSEGFFAEEGLGIELSNGGGADKVMAAVLTGDMDIGLAGPEASIYVYNAVSYTHLASHSSAQPEGKLPLAE